MADTPTVPAPPTPKPTGDFVLDLKAFVEKAREAPNTVVRKISLQLLTNVVMRTPVGNPDLWAVNRIAVEYNNEVAEWNSNLRSNPQNVDSRGRLKRGKKLNDGMDLVVPEGYVGGRLRANWFVSIGTDNRARTNSIDRDGSATINRGLSAIMSSDTTKGVFIKNNLPYAVPVEYGHSAMQAPQGMVRVTIAEIQTYVKKAVREVANQ